MKLIFETHAHYDDDAFDEDRKELLASMKEGGIGTIINVCSSVESLTTTKDLMESYSFIYGAAGLHPSDIRNLPDSVLEKVKELARHEKCVAIGEIGLDYYWDKDNKEEQMHMFGLQIELAKEEKLPVIVHSRDAAQDTLTCMNTYHIEEAGGVVHCFSYEKEMAREYINKGLYIGVGGVVTFKNARKLKETVEYAPLSSILLETDSPYMAPVPMRGKRNCSLYIPYIANAIAEIKGITAEEVVETTAENAKRLFGVSV